MPYDTQYTFEETTKAHATRLKRPVRWTQIRRRALLLKLDGLEPTEVQAQMGASNCPNYLAHASTETLTTELAVDRRGSILVPVHGAEPVHDLATIQDAAQELGLDTTVQELTKELAGGSNKLALAQVGVMLGHPPYGYRNEGTQQVMIQGQLRSVARIVINPTERVAVVMLFARYIEGWTFPQIAAELNDQKLPTRSGKPWSSETLRDMLRNPVYAGYVLYRGAEDRNRRDAGTLYPGLHPLIIPWQTFCQAQDARVQRHPRTSQPAWVCPWPIMP